MKIRYVIAAVAGIAFSAGASAQNMKPGLWEITNSMKSGSGQMEKAQAQMQQQMASMSPEQKKMMQEMMAKQGMAMGKGGPGGGMSVKTCMTKEQVERNEMPAQKGDCTTTKQEKSGNTMKFAVACTNPPSTGEGQITFTSSEAYNMKMAIRSMIDGKPETMNMEATGKWLGADCGSIKPMGPPPAGKK
jgi:hypothetical protein